MRCWSFWVQHARFAILGGGNMIPRRPFHLERHALDVHFTGKTRLKGSIFSIPSWESVGGLRATGASQIALAFLIGVV